MLELLSGLRDSIGLDRAVAIAERIMKLDLGRRVRTYSTGMKQKLMLAQTFADPVEILILDEPTSALDPSARGIVLDLVQEARRQGQTVIFSGHVLTEVEQVADRVAIMRRGRLMHIEDMKTRRSLRMLLVRFDRNQTPIPPPEPGIDRARAQGRHRYSSSIAASSARSCDGSASAPVVDVAIGTEDLRSLYDRYHGPNVSDEEERAMRPFWSLIRKEVQELRWALGLSALALFGLGWLFVYVTSRNESEIIKQLSSDSGDIGGRMQMFKALGIEGIPSSAELIMASWNHPFILILISAWAIGRGSGAVAAEVERGTMDLILSRPIPRWLYLDGPYPGGGRGLVDPGISLDGRGRDRDPVQCPERTDRSPDADEAGDQPGRPGLPDLWIHAAGVRDGPCPTASRPGRLGPHTGRVHHLGHLVDSCLPRFLVEAMARKALDLQGLQSHRAGQGGPVPRTESGHPGGYRSGLHRAWHSWYSRRATFRPTADGRPRAWRERPCFSVPSSASRSSPGRVAG